MAIIDGSGASETLNGTPSADEIYGLAGNDTLIGFNDDDVLEGGAGADEVFGSGGFDIASYKNSNEAVFVDLGGFEFFSGHAAGDHLYSIEGAIGSAFGDDLRGDDFRYVLRGLAGNDAGSRAATATTV
jgi:Ca2+-binding RTX toxin-like protein